MLTLDNNNKNLLWADSFLIRESGALHLILNKKKNLRSAPFSRVCVDLGFFFLSVLFGICGPVMCAVSRYSKELASYWVTVGDFQQKFEFDLGELLGDRIRAGRNSWKPADQNGSTFHVMNSVGVLA